MSMIEVHYTRDELRDLREQLAKIGWTFIGQVASSETLVAERPGSRKFEQAANSVEGLIETCTRREAEIDAMTNPTPAGPEGDQDV